MDNENRIAAYLLEAMRVAAVSKDVIAVESLSAAIDAGFIDNIPAQLMVAMAERECGKPEKAAVRLRRVLEAKPGDSLALAALGVAELDIGNRAASDEAWARAVAADPEMAPMIEEYRAAS